MLADDHDQRDRRSQVDDEIARKVAANAHEDDDDRLFEELEKELDNDFEMAGIRERRMVELKREFERVRDMRETNHGRYTEIVDEKEEKLCIVHFYHHDFARCKIMDKHLEELAPKYFGTRFVRVFVEKVPWLVDRLQVQVLPCIACFVDGVLKHRLIGFEELGNDDAFTTAALEMRLRLIGVIQTAGSTKKKVRTGRHRDDDDEDDDSS